MSFSIRDAALQRPYGDALILDGVAWSYRTLAEHVDAIAAPIDAEALTSPRHRVALVARPDMASVAALLALVDRGVPVVLLHPRSTAAERERLLADAPCAMIVDGERVERREVVLTPEAPPGELAVLATSGSTGTPRAVSLSRRALDAAAAASEANLGLRDDDRWLLALPFAHVGGLSVILRSLRARRAVVLLTPGAPGPSPASSPEALLRVVQRDRVTLISLVPTQLHRLLALDPPPAPPASLRAILVGGAAAPPALMAAARRRGWPVLGTYGLTESCAQAATERPGDAASDGVGPPLPGVELRITTEGAIALRGPTLCSGYLEAGVLRPLLDPEGWLVTRDAGRLDERGHLHVLGRLDDVIVTSGEKVHPLEVERALLAVPGIEGACVFGVPDAERGAVVAAALVTSARVDAGALAPALDPLASWKRPRLFATAPSLPESANGKLDRRATAALLTPRLRPLS